METTFGDFDCWRSGVLMEGKIIGRPATCQVLCVIKNNGMRYPLPADYLTEEWMAEVLKAMSVSGGILLVVVVLVVIVSIVAVNRGAAAMEDEAKRSGHRTHH
jgi:hypothetical protein